MQRLDAFHALGFLGRTGCAAGPHPLHRSDWPTLH
jgi:hypothetical protein